MTDDQSTKRRSLPRWLVRLLGIAAAGVAVPLGLLVGCQDRMIYFPRAYQAGTVADWQRMTTGKVVDFQTSQGDQRAFLQGNLTTPRKLWIVCGGNGTVALDWARWMHEHASKEDAWLLVDFPGYGACEGSPSPRRIRDSLKAAVPAACMALGWPEAPDSSRLRIFGHSLGAAACLIAASEFGIQRGVLIAPFTSTMDMAKVVTGLPIGFLVWQRFDNGARITEMAARGPGELILLHGTDDEVIPVAMSRTLSAAQPNLVRLREISGGRHNTILTADPTAVVAAMEEAGADATEP